MIITFDGESGSGKTSLAELVAKELEYNYISSGLIFRSFTYLYNLSYGNVDQIKELISKGMVIYKWENGKARMFINGSDVTDFLKDEKLGDDTSKLANDIVFYNFMVEMTKEIIKKSNIKNLVIDGRSVGKVFFPHADIKFFITADLSQRVERRHDQLKRQGKKTTYEEVLAQINDRDDRDVNREHFPLKPELDTEIIDNSVGSLDEKARHILLKINAFSSEKNEISRNFIK